LPIIHKYLINKDYRGCIAIETALDRRAVGT
jgi:hypothetical protein